MFKILWDALQFRMLCEIYLVSNALITLVINSITKSHGVFFSIGCSQIYALVSVRD